MNTEATVPINIVHLESLGTDAEFVAQELNKSGLNCCIKVVRSAPELKQTLREWKPGIVLSDHSLPDFNSLEAFELCKKHDPDIPFILVTSTVSEEFAVSMMLAGVDDYILKDRLQRLPASILSAVKKASTNKEKEPYRREIAVQEKRFRALIENIADAIILVDKDSKIIYNSPSVTRITGRSSKDLIGFSIFDFFETEDLAGAKEYFIKSIRAPGQPLQNEYKIKHADGRYIWLEGTINNLLHDPDIEAFIINYRDITERKNTEEVLRRSQATILSIVSHADRGYILLNKNLEVVSFNQVAGESFQRETGLNLTEGILPLEFLNDIQKELAKHHLDMALTGEKTFLELQFGEKTESPNWYHINVFPVVQEKGETLGIILDTENITNRKHAEFEKEKMTSEIVQRNKELEQFAYIVSHNLRSPVANMMGISYLLKDHSSLNRQELQKCLDGILASMKQIDEVIIDLNYIVQKKMQVRENMEIINLDSLVSSVKELIGVPDDDSRIRITTDFSEIGQIYTIKSYLHSIFYNLISNSIKYRDPHKSSYLRIKSSVNNKQVSFNFEDNGLGFNLEVYGDKVFGLYKKFHQSISSDGKGMGLFMVKMQAELLGGKISVESKENEGSRFTLLLPIST